MNRSLHNKRLQHKTRHRFQCARHRNNSIVWPAAVATAVAQLPHPELTCFVDRSDRRCLRIWKGPRSMDWPHTREVINDLGRVLKNAPTDRPSKLLISLAAASESSDHYRRPGSWSTREAVTAATAATELICCHRSMPQTQFIQLAATCYRTATAAIATTAWLPLATEQAIQKTAP